jgi:holo-[acyl-carrier protein] synthase
MLSAPTPRALSRARIGCDLQRVDVVEDAIRDFGARYLDRVYTSAEQASYTTGGASSLAARFAAKEAVLKLLGTTDGVDLRSIEIRKATERPEVHLDGAAADLARAAHIDHIDVSLSHTGDLAMAVAVAVMTDQPADPHDPDDPDDPAYAPSIADRRE